MEIILYSNLLIHRMSYNKILCYHLALERILLKNLAIIYIKISLNQDNMVGLKHNCRE